MDELKIRHAPPSAECYARFLNEYSSVVVVWFFGVDEDGEEFKHRFIFKGAGTRGIWILDPENNVPEHVSYRSVRAVVKPEHDKKKFSEIKDFIYKHPQAEEVVASGKTN